MALNLKEIFDEKGFLLIRRLIGEPHISRCLDEYRSDRVAKDVRWNPVEIPVPADGAVADLATHSAIGNIVHELIGEHAIYNTRLVVKGPGREKEVFVHQDCCYHVGRVDKLSAFVALTSVDSENGALRFYNGTHKFGYLGDAGELDPAVLDTVQRWEAPFLEPGDVVFMHSACWHGSWACKPGAPERVIADIIYMRSDDGARLISPEMREKMFKRSRVSRIKELQLQVDNLKGEI